MATTSAWAKPGEWALDSEENEAMEAAEGEHQQELLQQQQQQKPLSDFPSLATAASSKPSKKKKAQHFSLAEFTTGKQVTHGAAKIRSSDTAKGLTHDELLILPTGPRERSAEELERGGRLGGGFRSYGSGRENGFGGSSGGFGSKRENFDGEEGSSRWGGSSRVPDTPSRADETDDWAAGKKSSLGFERRERDRGFFDSQQQSRADDSDNWGSNKSFVPSENRRSGGGFENYKERESSSRLSGRSGFEIFSKEGVANGTGPDSDSWGRKGGEGMNGAGSGWDSWGRKGGEGSNGTGPAADSWGRKGGDEVSSGGRPKLVLQPRSLPGSSGELQQGEGRSKSTNPFGEARPREQVLAEKGQDWKKIEEKLEAVKIKDSGLGSGSERSDELGSFSKRSFGSGNGRANLPDERTERNWRKNEFVDTTPARAENGDGDAV